MYIYPVSLFWKYIHTIHRKRPDPIQIEMFMHTNVCRNRARDLLSNRLVFGPLHQSVVNIQVTGLDDLVTSEELAVALEEKAGCPSDFKVGKVRSDLRE
jgi:hypothetical protein